MRQTWAQTPTIDWSGGYRQPVVGESHYQPTFRAVAQMTIHWSKVRYVNARLVPEPNNQHDRHAVSVRLTDTVVGYIPREETRAYRAIIEHLAQWGKDATARAELTGGRQDAPTIGINLMVTGPPGVTTDKVGLLGGNLVDRAALTVKSLDQELAATLAATSSAHVCTLTKVDGELLALHHD